MCLKLLVHVLQASEKRLKPTTQSCQNLEKLPPISEKLPSIFMQEMLAVCHFVTAYSSLS